MAKVARIGDSISHGGQIITGAARTLAEGPNVARIGDTALCDLHGPVTIVTGSHNTPIEGEKCARIGSMTSCGAIVVTGAARTEVS